MRCDHCGLDDGLHMSDCPTRTKSPDVVPADPKVAELLEWSKQDRDVALTVQGVLRRRQLVHLSDLAPEVLDELHEAIRTMLEEMPTEDRPAWAR